MTLLLALPLLVVAGHLGVALVQRPQRGLLALAALLPFDGLLQVVPGGESVGPWKEALVLATVLAMLVSPASARRQEPVGVPPWLPPTIAFVALGAVSALVTGGIVGVWGFKIGFFYVLVPLVLWICPFDGRDRDHLVTILMATGFATAVFGLAQQVLGPEWLAAAGWEYNTAIRFSGGLLRSFSTFTQPFSFGLFVTMTLLVCLPVAMADHRRPRNLVFLLLSPVLVIGMATSVVRGASLGLAAGLLVLMVWRFRGLFHAGVIASLGFLFVPATVVTAYFSSSSLGERTTGWSTIIDKVTDAPLGNGIGRTGAAAEKALEVGADPSQVITLDGPGGRALYLPDNQYVKTVLDLGPIGLWLLVLVGAAVVAHAVSVSRRTTGSDRALAQGIAASVVGAAAASTVSTYLEIFPLDFYFWLLVGVLTCSKVASRSTPSPSAPEAAASRPTSVSSSVP
ncbi:O-antigen ligase domain-containing protein [Nocardioides rubriscoriae]|uniref:O-antigen ligase domain-containing protein n=1 Tax=Nocardioides rubriscoriae TaxID=642762 RepID=UPI0011DF1E25|nr:O-antigen ligase domain-containing protein [Nocardioides rubriscoriae]